MSRLSFFLWGGGKIFVRTLGGKRESGSREGREGKLEGGFFFVGWLGDAKQRQRESDGWMDGFC